MTNKPTKAAQFKQLGLGHYFGARLSKLIYFVGFALALIGSWQHYRPLVESHWKFLATLVYSIIKLFLFSPTIAVDKPAPLAYELAIWIAPIGTVLGFLKIFEKQYLRLRQFLTHYRRAHLVVLGAGPLSLAFMNNVQRENPEERLLCLVPDETAQKQAAHLERRGIQVLMLDYSKPQLYTNLAALKNYRLDKAKAIVSFDPEPENMGRAAIVNRWLSELKAPRIPFFMMSENRRLKELVEEQIRQWSCLDLHFFQLEDLRAMELMSRPDFALYETVGLSAAWQPADLASEIKLAERVGRARVLIVGFGRLGQAILHQAANMAVINPLRPMSLCLVDRQIKEHMDFFTAEVGQLNKVCELESLELDVRSERLLPELTRLHTQEAFSAVIFCLDDAQQSLLTLDRLNRLWSGVPCAVFCRKPSELQFMADSLNARGGQLGFFGYDRAILTPSVLLNDALMSRAKKFNAYYNEVAARTEGFAADTRTPEEQWAALNTLKKESSLAMAMHRPVKLRLLEKISEVEGQPDTPAALVAAWQNELAGLTSTQQVDLICADPVKNFLCELEHKRWNNFHYLRNFYFSEQKDLAAKRHDCLIDDWQEFLSGPQRDKAIYDFLAVLSSVREF